MSNLSQSSPFDSIRHEDEQGEYWLARELMPLLGYARWQKFEGAIERAILSCKNSQNDAPKHFLPEAVKSQGRTAIDYRLSRYGAYLIALNGDPRKDEIAAAQNYFVAKTREAEVIIPQQSERIRELEIQRDIAQANAEAMRHERALFERRASILEFNGEVALAVIDNREVAVVEKQVIESINIPQGTRYKGQTLPQIVDYVRKRYGLRLKNGGVIVKLLKAAEKENLIQKIPRKVDQDYIPEENLPQVYKLLTDGNRQMLIGE